MLRHRPTSRTPCQQGSSGTQLQRPPDTRAPVGGARVGWKAIRTWRGSHARARHHRRGPDVVAGSDRLFHRWRPDPIGEQTGRPREIALPLSSIDQLTRLARRVSRPRPITTVTFAGPWTCRCRDPRDRFSPPGALFHATPLATWGIVPVRPERTLATIAFLRPWRRTAESCW